MLSIFVSKFSLILNAESIAKIAGEALNVKWIASHLQVDFFGNFFYPQLRFFIVRGIFNFMNDLMSSVW